MKTKDMVISASSSGASTSGAERRAAVLELLTQAGSGEPISASALASRFSVSRQIMVGDIALLRSAGHLIDATPRGYILRRPKEYSDGSTSGGSLHTLICCHNAAEMVDELFTMVDFGCTVYDVAVEHPVYGTLKGELRLSSRYDVTLFAARIKDSDALPLSVLTEGVHSHTVFCPSEDIYALLRQALFDKGFLKESI